jgi:hypothetical protein
MSVTIVELKISEEIAASTDVTDTYTPPNGAEVWVELFHGNAAYTTNSAVMLLWDYNAAGEEVVWSTKGSDSFNIPIKITGADGTKKIAVCCSNGDSGDLVFSGYARIKVIT